MSILPHVLAESAGGYRIQDFVNTGDGLTQDGLHFTSTSSTQAIDKQAQKYASNTVTYHAALPTTTGSHPYI